MKIITKKNEVFIANFVVELYLNKFEHFFHSGSNPLESENKRVEFENTSTALLLSPNGEQAFLDLLIPGLRFTADDQRCLSSRRQHRPALLLLRHPTADARKPTSAGQEALQRLREFHQWQTGPNGSVRSPAWATC